MNQLVRRTDKNQVLTNQRELELPAVWQAVDEVQLAETITEIEKPEFPLRNELDRDECVFFRVKKLSYDEKFPQRQLLENVLLSFDNPYFNFVYLLTGDGNGVSLYFGVVQNRSMEGLPADKLMSVKDYAANMVASFEGNFNGTEMTPVKNTKDFMELDEVVLHGVDKYRRCGVITGIPSVATDDSTQEYDFQGIDRLINSMLGAGAGSAWRLAVVCEAVPREEVKKQQQAIYDLYRELVLRAEMQYQVGMNTTQSETRGKSESTNKGKSFSDSSGTTTTHNWNDKNDSKGTSTNVTKGTNESATQGTSSSASQSEGKNQSLSLKVVDKRLQELIKYIDEELLERLKLGLSRAVFKTTIFYMAERSDKLKQLETGIKALMQGDQSLYSPLIAQEIDIASCHDFLQLYQHPRVAYNIISPQALQLLGRPFEEYENLLGVSTYLTSNEVSVVAGLPQKEVPGLLMQKGIDFGLNEREFDKEAVKIELGTYIQKGKKLDAKFYLDRNALAKHVFVAGTTGSGKTTTCHTLLKEAQCPFLVIEPAKTEYRTLLKNGFSDLVIFTLGDEQLAPFRLNPFELIKGENISSHIDMLKATFTSAFPMEGSMPQLMEEAIIHSYEVKGWDIASNTNEIYGDTAFNPECKDAFPIMSDLLSSLKNIVDEKGFGERLGSEYRASLISRLSNLTVGTKGRMVNCRRSIDFNYIAHHNVVIEMEEMKAPEDKALFMGFILTKLATVIKAIHKDDVDYRHLTLVEEAHRLLSKVELGDPGSKKSSVETFADLLAEVRKYGEGLIIVDQIPNKMASEVLKNTNTKIIHTIFSRDDREAVGDAMLMDDKQKAFLAGLSVGEAVVFTTQTDKPAQIKINKITETDEREIPDSDVKKRFDETLNGQNLGNCYDDYKIQALQPYFMHMLSDVETAIKESKGQRDIDLSVRCGIFWDDFQRVQAETGLESSVMWDELFHYRNVKVKAGEKTKPQDLVDKRSTLVKLFARLFEAQKIAASEALEVMEKLVF